MQRNNMLEFLLLLNLTTGCLYKFHVTCIKFPGSRKRSSQLNDMTSIHINTNYITSTNSFFGQLLDHLLTKIIYGLHVCSFHCNFSTFNQITCGSINLNFNNFPLNNS
eukprot:NODE_187_length_13529_cov_1.102606.p10 type:complete len:108 gc:universal NODE_187_length_13529_cov_1.102606:6991-7314(+)